MPQIAAYHKKLFLVRDKELQIRLKTYYEVLILAETCTTRDWVTCDNILLKVNQVIALSLDSCLVKNLSSLLELRCRDKA